MSQAADRARGRLARTSVLSGAMIAIVILKVPMRVVSAAVIVAGLLLIRLQ